MNHETLMAQGPVDVTVSCCTVRVKTTVWADKRGLHTKKSLTFLRRQCEGFNVLAEDVSAIGAEEVLPRILNLGKVEDGIYEVVVCNESRDYETGYVDDYDYRLVTANVRANRPRSGPVERGVGRLVPERDQAGPRGTYGCACKSRDDAECHRMRYGIVAGDVSHGAEECYCLCHQWSDDDEDFWYD